MDAELTARARIHAALGEPARLAIVDELALSDRSPSELAQRFELPSNLVAHHLDVLDAAGLIERFASSGDRRRKYVRLRRDHLVGGPLGLRAVPQHLVFVCSLNSARSQLAAALWTARTGRAAASGGTRPADRVHPGAVAAARRAGLDISAAVPGPVPEIDTGTVLVTVCDQAHEELAASDAAWHWSIPDPVAQGTDDAFDTTIRQLGRRISVLTGAGTDA